MKGPRAGTRTQQLLTVGVFFMFTLFFHTYVIICHTNDSIAPFLYRIYHMGGDKRPFRRQRGNVDSLSPAVFSMSLKLRYAIDI